MTNNSRINFNIIFNSTIPIIIGALIYIFFRTNSLFVFNWLKTIGLYDFVIYLRTFTIPYRNYLPHWILFSLPDALWTYSITYLMLGIWCFEKSNIKYLWIFLGPFVGITSEILQIYKVIPGTFDVVDLYLILFFVLFTFSSFYIQLHQKKKMKNNEN